MVFPTLTRFAKRAIRHFQQVTQIALLVASIAFVLRVIFGYAGTARSPLDLTTRIGQNIPKQDLTSETNAVVYPVDENATIWQLISRDPSLGEYVSLLTPFEDFRQFLDDPNRTFTLYAPVNAAFAEPSQHPVDPPNFYWKFLVLNHMGPGRVSYEALTMGTTVPVFLHHDPYGDNLQRISSKGSNGEVMFNHVARYVGEPLQAINGIVHHIDRLLYLSNAVSALLRRSADLQTFHRGLIATDVAVAVNDTSEHLSQTVFAPTEAAFEKLGSRLTRFLFSPWGKPYFAALLRFHVVMNATLFTDVYFQPDRKGQVPMSPANGTLALETLLAGHMLQARIVHDRARPSIEMNGGEVVVSEPDLIMMDGVVHKIDTVLFPPLPETEAGMTLGTVSRMWVTVWKWIFADEGMSVEELMERLSPFIDEAAFRNS